ncbi:GNAT family N-acetyltransferase [Pacificimonas sp. WHA3]|uniref:GNAT family N-acetyltransferase n=1 Tax=Pacificimonas pallii TaxID=2827236 RepID=A0ABS6SC07_9SPHN|nr:GNAT family protein [Pacificimonas pallii]MBV7255953.1 GNAT family N-acetyltransferase [Pacificimonas pallii]
MSPDVILGTALADGDIRLAPFQDTHLPALRQACAEDQDVWDIYPYSMLGAHFDVAVARLAQLAEAGSWVRYTAFHEGRLVGMTNYINPDKANGVVEIGGTYFVPSVRGTAFNGAIKRLMIDHAFAAGFRRVEFRVDARNGRSQRAVEKLGAVREGQLRRNRVTWTGYVRDTVVFGLLADEWQAR